MPDTPANSRRELIIVAAMTLVGAVLRFWTQGRLGLNHFDEGIYAIAGMWSVTPKGLAGISPELVSYAPPLYPILIGVLYLFLGVSDVSAIMVSQIAGVLTIPAVAWVARRTFGRGAGAAASALVAISGPHICFSRMALTDSTFLLCWVLAIGFGGRFLERPGVLRAIPFGLMVGLAQNAKYNGYLAGAIVALTAVWGMVKPGDGGWKFALRAIGFGLIAAVISLAVYWPWYRFVQSQPGGYAGLLKHHRSYLTGTTSGAWFHNWRLQMTQSFAVSGELGVKGLCWGAIAWPLAWVGGTFSTGLVRGVGHRAGMRRRLGFVLGSAVLGIAPNAGWWVALASVPWWLADRSAAKRTLAVGWLVMAILTPFYHPYARLWLPLQAFGWIALAGLVPDPSIAAEDEIIHSRTWRDRLQIAALALGVIVGVLSDSVAEPRARHLGSPIEPTDSMRLACERVATYLEIPPSPTPQRLQIVARPAVMYYLSRRLKIPPIRQPDIHAVFRSWQPGDYVLMDSTIDLVSSEDAYPFATEHFNNTAMSRAIRFYEMNTPGITHLDIDPGSSLDPHVQIKIGSALDIYPIIPR